MILELTESEKVFILQRRIKEKQRELHQFNSLRLLTIAAEYAAWLNKEGRGTSYSIFHSEFGYDDEFSSEVYQKVIEIINSVSAKAAGFEGEI